MKRFWALFLTAAMALSLAACGEEQASSSSTARKSSPLLELKAPGTFSQIAKVGYIPFVFALISFMIRIASMKSPDRSPARPALRPAMERSWQGLPNVMQFTGSIWSPQIFVISPR